MSGTFVNRPIHRVLSPVEPCEMGCGEKVQMLQFGAAPEVGLDVGEPKLFDINPETGRSRPGGHTPQWCEFLRERRGVERGGLTVDESVEEDAPDWWFDPADYADDDDGDGS